MTASLTWRNATAGDWYSYSRVTMKTNDSRGWEWSRIRREALDRNRRDLDGRCQARLDGCLGEATQVHHVVERADGGGDDPHNLMAICEACHTRVTVEANQRRASARRGAKKEKKRKNHPGRRDRYES